jgi:diguanylate cyclase (GGDEF)-like protein/PAS domain S-box-containing protein
VHLIRHLLRPLSPLRGPFAVTAACRLVVAAAVALVFAPYPPLGAAPWAETVAYWVAAAAAATSLLQLLRPRSWRLAAVIAATDVGLAIALIHSVGFSAKSGAFWIGPVVLGEIGVLAGGTELTLAFVAMAAGYLTLRVTPLNGPPRLANIAIGVAASAAVAAIVWRVTRHTFADMRRFRGLMQGLDQIVWETDATMSKLLFVSDQFENVAGVRVSQAELLAVWAHELTHPDDREAQLEWCTSVMREGSGTFEHRIEGAEGVRWMRSHARLLRDTRGRPLSVVGTTLDVTAEVQARRELLEAEERYRLLVEGLPVIPYRDSLDGSESHYVSPRLETLLGYTVQEWHEGGIEWWMRIVHRDDVIAVARSMEESIERQEPRHLRYRVRHADGRYVWFDDDVLIVYDAAGAPLFRQGVLRDVTAEVGAHSALAAAQERYRMLVEALPLAVYVDEPDEACTSVYMSPQIEGMLGYPAEMWVGNSQLFSSLLHPDEREQVLAAQAAWLEAGGSYSDEYRLMHRDGRAVWVREESQVVTDAEGVPLYVQGYLEDVTERHERAAKLAESEARLRMIADNLTDVIFLYDANKRLQYVTPSCELLTGYTVEEAFQKNFLGDVHPEDEQRMLALWRGLWEGERYTGAEFRIVNRYGVEHWCWSAGAPVYDSSGVLVGVQIRDADISARKRMEMRLRASEERARAIIETTDDAFVSIDSQGMVIEWNRAAEQMFGRERDDTFGMDVFTAVVADRSRDTLHELLVRTGEEGDVPDRAVTELTARRFSGEEFPIEVALWPVRFGGDLTFNAFIRDITDRKLREERVNFLAYHDRLTGLPNRTMFEQHLDLVLARAAHDATAAAVLYLDVDKFKSVNDTYGHDAGDLVLQEVARRLRSAARASDLVVRLGGDEFLIVLADVPPALVRGVAEQVAQRVCEGFTEPFDLGGTSFQTSTSIGIGVYPDNARDGKSLVQTADWGMYASKRAGRGGYTFFEGPGREAA